MKIVNRWLLVSFLGFFICCESPPQQKVPSPTVLTKKSSQKEKIVKHATHAVEHKDYTPIYPWKQSEVNQLSVYHIPVQKGYRRMPLSSQSQFAYWLRHLPVKPAGSKVYHFNGMEKPYQEGAYSVIDIDVGKRDLQQCADAVMRLKAEYHYSKKDYKNIHFNYTSGHSVSFDDWRKGKQPKVSGSSVGFTAPSGKTDNTYRNFKRYMNAIFSYAGTASLSREMKPIPISKMQIGDVFIQGGFPGHAVIVVDMIEDINNGKKMFMLAQSYMPAQSIHVLINPKVDGLSPWYPLDFKGELHTPEWKFTKKDLKRFQ